MPVKLMKVSREVVIPDNVTIDVKARKVWVKGPRGKLFRNFKHAQVDIKKIMNENGKLAILVEKRFSKKKDVQLLKLLPRILKIYF